MGWRVEGRGGSEIIATKWEGVRELEWEEIEVLERLQNYRLDFENIMNCREIHHNGLTWELRVDMFYIGG